MPKRKSSPDHILLILLIIIIVFGLLVLISASAPISEEKTGTTYYFLTHQIIFGLLPGLVLGYLFFRLPLDSLKKWSLYLFLANLIFSIMVFFPHIGMSLGGASRWLSIGSISFQPSEFLKLTSVLYLGSWLSKRTENKKNINQTFLGFLAIIGLVGLILIFQPDISTLGMIVLIAGLMYFASGTPLWHSASMIVAGVIALFVLIKIAPYRMARLLVFLQPDTDPMGIGYQIKQVLIAIGSGGIFGLGLGLSRQKLGFLPQSMSDSIFAVLAEEMGFIGCLFLILLFLIFFWRAFKIARLSPDKFSQLVVVGISSWIFFQAFINIGSMTGILPLTGIPLPFISYGGSALVAELSAMGIIFNISKKCQRYPRLK